MTNLPQMRAIELEDICEFQVLDAVQMTVHQFAESLSHIIDAKDHSTHSHSEEVAVMSQTIGQQMGLSAKQSDILHLAGHLHDIGKVGIQDAILKKRGPLTRKEFNIIKKHPVIGAQIMAPVAPFAGKNGIVKMILHHHERFDGNGYPDGLRARNIPLGARIIAVADSLSAMLQDRPYRRAMFYEEALQEIYDCSGSQFDPVVVNALFSVKGIIKTYLCSLHKNKDVA
ncbi:HD-GYP domain-containing protein [Pseudodesulfovibrio piezophilus]|uniref:Metal dependent phosphohydrolase n=1 Tax=Pseudodesulfovibrio piezophilus (strain DSM 21447 / JCM 15486 / C1TLV30) TaxID=1322246 RepID=M1WU28_PSEP2|nr:HD-GYP domain-containing protein [Pseudodesulfovibrio piezophilus]CCH50172.1 Metal dependent phosphohydrolase [Pseudodesulfovibrio piezophilus C1TLV30]